MKSNILYLHFLAMFFAIPAALAVDANSCAAKSTQLGLAKRNAYMESCLAQVSSPANVKEAELRHKRALCEQNAKNYKLQGNNRASYTMTCLNKNEAEAAIKSANNQITSGKKAARSASYQADAKVHPEAKSKPKAKVVRKAKLGTTGSATQGGYP